MSKALYHYHQTKCLRLSWHLLNDKVRTVLNSTLLNFSSSNIFCVDHYHHSPKTLIKICIFIWPKIILKCLWSNLIESTLHNQMLIFSCAYEAHLRVNFAMAFQKSFLLLKVALFDKLKIGDSLKMAIIFMIVVLSSNLLHPLSNFIKYSFINQFVY